jgi:hypothetical protein
MNYEINEINQFSPEFANFGIDPQDSMHGITEKNRVAVGNSPEYLDLSGWEGKTANRQATPTLSLVNEIKQEWSKQFGSYDDDASKGIAADKNGNIYLTGETYGDLAGKNAGYNTDIWIAKYDSTGKQVWAKQFGSSDYDYLNGIAIDKDGNVYLTGETYGDLAGKISGGYGYDAWVAKYDSTGKQVWAKQFGTSAWDESNGIATDISGNVYLTGSTSGDLAGTNAGGQDPWLAKYDSTGKQLWTKQFGSSSYDYSNGIATDSSGNVYLTGSFGTTKYDSSGEQLWNKQSYDYDSKITTDNSGNLYKAKASWGNYGYDEQNIEITKYDSDGNKLWSKTFGSYSADYPNGIATDSAGNVYLTGKTDGNIESTNAGSWDAWVAKYDSSGNQLWTKQFGTSYYESSEGIAIDSSGNIYFTGKTYGTPENSDFSSWNAWVTKLSSSLPTIALTATDAKAAETISGQTSNPGKLTVTRTGDLTNSLTVGYKVSGSATKGTDYKLPSTITFAAGVSSVKLPVSILDDVLVEGTETATVNLTAGVGYQLAQAKSGTVSIADND